MSSAQDCFYCLPFPPTSPNVYDVEVTCNLLDIPFVPCAYFLGVQMWKSHVICPILFLSCFSCRVSERWGGVGHLNTSSKEKWMSPCMTTCTVRCSHVPQRPGTLFLCHVPISLRILLIPCHSHLQALTCKMWKSHVICPILRLCLVPICHSDFVICKVVCKEKRHAWTHIEMEQKITWKHTKGKTKLKVISLWFSSVFWLECYFSTILLY